MSAAADVVVIGSGLNGLVAGAQLAKKKLSVVILEQRDQPGGAMATAEFVPGFRGPALSHALGPIAREVVRALHLDRAGLSFIAPEPALTTLGAHGEAIVFHRDAVLTAGSIHAQSVRDAGRWSDFLKTIHRLSAIVGAVQAMPPPATDDLPMREWWRLLRIGRQARRLGSTDLARLARWIPMSIADLTGEWFEHDLLRAAIAAQAIFGNPAGPRSAGTGAMWLQRVAADPMPVGGGSTVQDGPGAVTDALVAIAQRAGATLRTAAHVVRVTARGGRVTGVVLGTGEEIPARAVLCAIDPRQAFLHLVDPIELPTTFVERMRHYRARGVTATMHLALAGPPAFTAIGADPMPLKGRILIAPSLDYLERAFDATKYGARSEHPWIDLSVPSIVDGSLAPAGQHVLSMHVHFAPRHLREGSWNTEGEALYAAAISTLEAYAPGIGAQIVGREIITPEDLEQRWGLSGGHIFHGEPALDQTWITRPQLGWAQYRSPLRGLYLGGAGAHPGGGLTGRPGLLAADALLSDWKTLPR